MLLLKYYIFRFVGQEVDGSRMFLDNETPLVFAVIALSRSTTLSSSKILGFLWLKKCGCCGGRFYKGQTFWNSGFFKGNKEIFNLAISQNGIDMRALLKSTCNTFLKTLEECMQIANAAFTSELLHRTPPGSPHLTVPKSNKVSLCSLSCQTRV